MCIGFWLRPLEAIASFRQKLFRNSRPASIASPADCTDPASRAIKMGMQQLSHNLINSMGTHVILVSFNSQGEYQLLFLLCESTESSIAKSRQMQTLGAARKTCIEAANFCSSSTQTRTCAHVQAVLRMIQSVYEALP